MQQPHHPHAPAAAPAEPVSVLIRRMNGELRDETRAALVAALCLKSCDRPWDQLLPVILAGLPALADALGPVTLSQLEHGFTRPRWSPPSGADVRWYDTLASLELAALLVPRHTMIALNHRRMSGHPAAVEWLEGEGHPGLAGLL